MNLLWYAIPILALSFQDPALPLQEGGAWTYDVEERTAGSVTATGQATAVVGEAISIGGKDWVKVTDWLGYDACWLRVGRDSLRLRLDTEENAPVLDIVRFEARAGQTWTGTLGDTPLTFRMEDRAPAAFGKRTVEARRISVTFGGHEGHEHPAPRGEFTFAAGIGILEARLQKELDCHSAATRVYRLRPSAGE